MDAIDIKLFRNSPNKQRKPSKTKQKKKEIQTERDAFNYFNNEIQKKSIVRTSQNSVILEELFQESGKNNTLSFK